MFSKLTKISFDEFTSLSVVCEEFSQETWGSLTANLVSSVVAWKEIWRNFFVKAVCIFATVVKGGRKCNVKTVSFPASHGSSIISWKSRKSFSNWVSRDFVIQYWIGIYLVYDYKKCGFGYLICFLFVNIFSYDYCQNVTNIKKAKKSYQVHFGIF